MLLPIRAQIEDGVVRRYQAGIEASLADLYERMGRLADVAARLKRGERGAWVEDAAMDELGPAYAPLRRAVEEGDGRGFAAALNVALAGRVRSLHATLLLDHLAGHLLDELGWAPSLGDSVLELIGRVWPTAADLADVDGRCLALLRPYVDAEVWGALVDRTAAQLGRGHQVTRRILDASPEPGVAVAGGVPS